MYIRQVNYSAWSITMAAWHLITGVLAQGPQATMYNGWFLLCDKWDDAHTRVIDIYTWDITHRK